METAAVWANDLAHVDVMDAVDAATLHYRESDKWMMPQHVIFNVKRIREERERAARRPLPIESPEVRQARLEEFDRGIRIYKEQVASLVSERD